MLKAWTGRPAFRSRFDVMEHADCGEQSRLFDQYSRAVTSYSLRSEAARRAPDTQSANDWLEIERARDESEAAWKALEEHIARHRCLGLPNTASVVASSEILGQAAAAALDAIVVADDQRRFIALNDAAVEILGMARTDVLGRCIDEFFSSAAGEDIPTAWRKFIAEGMQIGICELSTPGPRRRFEYRAKSNFAQGVHLSVLREVKM
jgi:PAS domain-containing protein